LKKKQKKILKDSQAELQINLSGPKEVFSLPSGQDVEKESVQPPDLQILQERIREVIKYAVRYKFKTSQVLKC